MSVEVSGLSRSLRYFSRQVEYFDGDVLKALDTLKEDDKDRLKFICEKVLYT